MILIFIFFLGLYGQRMQNYFLIQRQEKLILEGERRAAEILEIQKADNYGGKTPEETLDLYIQALKAGDIELASKYYEISLDNMELQGKELDNLREEIQNDGDLSVIIKNTTDIKVNGIKNTWSLTEASFVYSYVTLEQSTSTSIVSGQEIITVRPKGIQESVGISFRLNPYTKIWKIIQ